MANAKVEKAQLVELDQHSNPKGKPVTVQFNPETLKVSFANQVVPPKGSGDNKEKSAIQFVGAGTTKLTLQLWFDVTGQPPDAKSPEVDVRELTKQVAYFITPQKKGNDFIPPAVRFQWGSFHFDGIMDSMEESLEFFSSDGVPLRANVSLSLSQQRIEAFSGRAAGAGGAGGGPPGAAGPAGAAPGTQPLAQARAGDTLQGLAAGVSTGAGAGVSWQAIANANNIENPRFLEPGQFVNLNVNVSASFP
jgi:hypothetical protein